MIYLYLKTHNVTGLKYLGKTTQDPYQYKGSGIHWKRHIEKYGNDVSTSILFQTEDKEVFKEVALDYSHKLNIVESKEFANMTHEEGQGGHTAYSKERSEKLSELFSGRKNTWVKKGHNKGKIVAYDIVINKNVSVTKEEFQANDNLIGISAKNKGQPKTEEWKASRRKNPHNGRKVIYKDKEYVSLAELMRRNDFDRKDVYALRKIGAIKDLTSILEVI